MRLREHAGIIPGRIDILYCKPSEITIEEGYNVRDLTTAEARAELDELKEQVREHGVLTPLKIRFDGERIILVEGHRRRTVALELISEYEASGGTEGRNIVSVPIFPEAPGTTVEERDAGLLVSNTGSRLKPLELANLIYRMHTVRGMPLEAVAKSLGISMPVLKNHLAMRAMPEPVKEHVREGDISATEAAKLVKTLPAGTDPNFAANLIKANKEENKRLGVGAKRDHKVTAKTLKRDNPKPEPKAASAPAAAATAQPFVTEVETPAPLPLAGTTATTVGDDLHQPHPQLQTAVERERGPAMADVNEQISRIVSAPPPRSYDTNQKFFAIIARLATIGEENELNERSDDEMISVPAEVIKAADRAYREHIGDVP